MLKLNFFWVSQLCKMCWSEVKNNNRRTEKEGSWSPCSSCVRGVLQSREKQQYLSLIHVTSLAVAVVQMHSSWKSVSVVLEPHKVPLSSGRIEFLKTAQQQMPQAGLRVNNAWTQYSTLHFAWVMWPSRFDHKTLRALTWSPFTHGNEA